MPLLAGRGIARKRDPGRAIGAEVAEHHRLHGDRGAPVARDIVELAIGHRAIVVPRSEDRADRFPQLLVADPAECRGRRASRIRARNSSTSSLQVIDREIDVLADPARFLLRFDQFLERIAIVLVLGLELQHDVAVHLAKAPVGIPGEARTAAHRLRGPRRSRRSGRDSAPCPSCRASKPARRIAPRPATDFSRRRTCARAPFRSAPMLFVTPSVSPLGYLLPCS